MEKLLQSTDAYKIFTASGTKSHAFLLAIPDRPILRPALSVFGALFYKDNARARELVKKNAYSDCIFLPSEGEKFTVADAETVAEECVLKPVEGDKKLFILDLSDANPQSQNKLLKILEEPPESVSFLLGTTSLFSVLPTVLSRVEKAEIPAFKESEIKNYLLRSLPTVSEENARTFALASGGLAGNAMALATGGYFSDLCDKAYSLALADEPDIPVLLKKYGEFAHKKEFLSLLKSLYRDALVLKTENKFSGSDIPLFLADKGRTEKLKNKLSLSALLYAQEALTETEKNIFFNSAFSFELSLALAKIAKQR